MSFTITSRSCAGATLLLALAAGSALAQAGPPKSTKRIPITKEAAGELARDTVIRVDTVQITNTIYRTDTLTMTRVDTVLVQPPAIPIRLPNGFYFGVAGGSSSPGGSFFTPNGMGYIGQAQIGWQNAKQILGGRISGSYTGLGEDTQFSQGTHGKLWSLSTDAKLNLPLGHVFGMTPRLNAYGIGGWTYTWFRDTPHRINTPDNAPLAFVLGNDSWSGHNGWDAGGGLSLLFNRSELFVESRAIGFKPSDSPRAYQVPLVFGFNWY